MREVLARIHPKDTVATLAREARSRRLLMKYWIQAALIGLMIVALYLLSLPWLIIRGVIKGAFEWLAFGRWIARLTSEEFRNEFR